MRVLIIDRSYEEKKLYIKKKMIAESSINKTIETLESNGYVVKGVQLVNYENEEKERVLITYE